MWDVMGRCSRQLRIAPLGGVVGLDMGIALQVADAMGYPRRDVARLLPYAEAGLLAGLARQGAGQQGADQQGTGSDEHQY